MARRSSSLGRRLLRVLTTTCPSCGILIPVHLWVIRQLGAAPTKGLGGGGSAFLGGMWCKLLGEETKDQQSISQFWRYVCFICLVDECRGFQSFWAAWALGTASWGVWGTCCVVMVSSPLCCHLSCYPKHDYWFCGEANGHLLSCSNVFLNSMWVCQKHNYLCMRYQTY